MTENPGSDRFDVLVCGGGLVGLTAATAIARSGLSVCLVSPGSQAPDPRTTAMLADTIDFMNTLGVWQDLEGQTHPLKTMRLVDATQRLFRFPQSDFQASEIGLEAFGYNVRNQDMLDTLNRHLAETKPDLTRFSGTLKTIQSPGDGTLVARVNRENGPQLEIQAGFVIGADGRNSLVRRHFGFGEREWAYPQSAIVLDFEHEHSSRFTSTEFHTEAGPFTVVPQTEKTAGLVWLETPHVAERVSQMDFLKLGRLLEDKMGSWLGRVTVLNRPHVIAMSGLTANRFGDQEHALVGEAAHVFPPIGAQGFNLGVRDIRELVNCLGQYTRQENVGRQYHRARTSDIYSRTMGVDMLNRSLLSDFLPVQLFKAAGIMALGKITPLRKQAMRSGIAPIWHANG